MTDADYARQVATDAADAGQPDILTPDDLQTLQDAGYSLSVSCNGTCPDAVVRLPDRASAAIYRYDRPGYDVYVGFAVRRPVVNNYPTLQAAIDAVNCLRRTVDVRQIVRAASALGFADSPRLTTALPTDCNQIPTTATPLILTDYNDAPA